MKTILGLVMSLVICVGCDSGIASADAADVPVEHQDHHCCKCEHAKLSKPVRSKVYAACVTEEAPLLQGNYYEMKDGKKVYFTLCRGLEKHECVCDEHK